MKLKKISLGNVSDILNSKEMKKVFGGGYDNGCSSSCSGPCGSGINYPDNNYCANTPDGCRCASASAG